MLSGGSDASPHSRDPVLLGSTAEETAMLAEHQTDEGRGGNDGLSKTTVTTTTGDRASEATDQLAAMSSPDTHTFPDFVLREKSRACKLKFKKCLDIPGLPHEDWLEQRSAEFNWWTSGLNADKNGPGSLDARLRLRADVTAVIVDALDGLDDALSTYHELATSDPSPSDGEDPPGLIEAEDGSTTSARAPSPWSDMSSRSSQNSTSAATNEEEENEEREDAESQRDYAYASSSSDMYAEQRVYIENNLEVLIRIHTAIKLSGLKLRNRRADDALRHSEQEYARQKLTLGAHEALAGPDGEHERFRRYLTKLVLRNGYTEDLIQRLCFRIYQLAAAERWQDARETRDSKDSQEQTKESHAVLLQRKTMVVIRAYLYDSVRLTTVQRRLIDANIIRRNRMIHAGSASKTPSHVREGRSQATPQVKSPIKSIPQRGSLMAGNVTPSPSNLSPSPVSRPVTQSKQGSHATKSFVAQPATALESNFSITGALKPALRSTARSAGTKMSARVGHLDYPSCSTKEDGPFPCDYCPMILPPEYRKKEKWRGHVAQDLCGYVCVFEDCKSPEDMFASTYEWMAHMARFHSEIEWVCPLCTKHRTPDAADNAQAASFPDPSQLQDHLLASHPASDAAADPEELALVVSAGQRTVGIRKVRCPLCRPGLVTGDEEIDDCAVSPHPQGEEEGLVQLEEDQHVATHIHEFALHAFPSADGEELSDQARESISSQPSTRVDIKFEGPRLAEDSPQAQKFAYTLDDIRDMIGELDNTLVKVRMSSQRDTGTYDRLKLVTLKAEVLYTNLHLEQEEVDLDDVARVLSKALALASQLDETSSVSDNEGPQIMELLEDLEETLRYRPSLVEAGRQVGQLRDGPLPWQVIHDVECDRQPEEHVYYLETPWVVEDGPFGAHLTGSQPIRIYDDIRERDRGSQFDVYREYLCCESPLTQALGKSSLDLAASSLWRGESISFKARELRTQFVRLMEVAFQGIPVPWGPQAQGEINYPYVWFFHRRGQIQVELNKLGGHPTAQLHMHNFWEHVQNRTKEEWAIADNLLSTGMLSSEYMEYLIVPGEIVISKSEGNTLAQVTAFVATYWPQVMRISPNSMYSASSPAYTWTFDGRFRKTHKAQKITAEDFANLEDPCRIIDLPKYPSKFASKDLIEALRQRGRQFWRCRGKRYVSLHSDVDNNSQTATNPRFMIDMSFYKRVHAHESGHSSAHPEGEELEAEYMSQDDPPLGDEFFMCLPPSIPGFNMRNKEWVNLDVYRIREVVWNMGAFDFLAIDPNYKEFLMALLRRHHAFAPSKHADLNSKAWNSLVILLHGAPGSGKTSTAESFAETAQLPIYRVTGEDVGTEAAIAERNLEDVFTLGKEWRCVVLIDEADYLLAQRTDSDLQRNAVVAVFLRMLEYYDGILVLTSNDDGAVDDAFRSHIDIDLPFQTPGQQQRVQIWRNLLQKRPPFEENGPKDDMKISQELEPGTRVDDTHDQVEGLATVELNGHQIKNAIFMARQLAARMGELMGYKHLHFVVLNGEIASPAGIAKWDRKLQDLVERYYKIETHNTSDPKTLP